MSGLIITNLPTLIDADDYHEFPEKERFLQQITGSKSVKVKEIGFDAPRYIGVVYTGRMPGKTVINKLLEDKGIVLSN